ncbi:MAG: ABC transporter permease subunit [Eubacteriales bacterium]|nr:ABC transporter permease subunit [Eubacteriales bacterium]
MLNLALLKETMRENRRLWLHCTLILVLGILLCESVYGTEAGEKMRQFLSVIPGMTGRMGEAQDASLISFLGTCLYGAVFLLVPAIYSAILSVRLIGRRLEDGSMAGLISVIGNRSEILFTQAYWMGTSLLGMFVCTSLAGILGGAVLRPGRLETAQYLLMNLSCFCMQVLIGGICFLLASLLKKERTASLTAAGVLTAGYLFFALPDLDGGLSALGYFSVFSVFSPEKAIEGSGNLFWELPVLAVAGLLLYKAGSMVLTNADIPS